MQSRKEKQLVGGCGMLQWKQQQPIFLRSFSDLSQSCVFYDIHFELTPYDAQTIS